MDTRLQAAALRLDGALRNLLILIEDGNLVVTDGAAARGIKRDLSGLMRLDREISADFVLAFNQDQAERRLLGSRIDDSIPIDSPACSECGALFPVAADVLDHSTLCGECLAIVARQNEDS